MTNEQLRVFHKTTREDIQPGRAKRKNLGVATASRTYRCHVRYRRNIRYATFAHVLSQIVVTVPTLSSVIRVIGSVGSAPRFFERTEAQPRT